MKAFKIWLSGMAAVLALAAPRAWSAIPAHPGFFNYVEGQAQIDGWVVTNTNVGAAEVGAGKTIETSAGKAEVLLTPGVLLRLGDNSAVRMDSLGLTDTRLTLLRGRAMIEADNLRNENHIRVADQNSVTTLEKNGIYSFGTAPPEVATFDGKAQVTEDDQNVQLGKGHETTLQTPLHSVKFDRKADEKDSLYQWSSVRSEYLAEANVDQARTIVVNGFGWYGPGWYWNPWFDMYSWIPGDGFFTGPFGWGFYSPFYVWAAPVYYGHGNRGPYPYRGVPAVRGAVRGPAPAMRGFSGGFSRGGFAGGGFSRGGRR
jgi:hypothetical protein